MLLIKISLDYEIYLNILYYINIKWKINNKREQVLFINYIILIHQIKIFILVAHFKLLNKDYKNINKILNNIYKIINNIFHRMKYYKKVIITLLN
jgi:hypothetical protein